MRIAAAIFILISVSAFLFADSDLPDACKLLTAEDVENVVGPGFTLSPFRGTASDNSNCGYLKDPGNVVNLMVVNAGQEITGALNKLQQQHTQQDHVVVPFTRAGEGAFSVEYTNAWTKERVIAVHFGKGIWHGVLDVKVNGKPDMDAERKLARIAYSRFP